jgi:hypothetical protein
MISQQIRLRVGLWALLLVLVAGHLLATPFAALAQTGIQVYALQGTLRAASGQPFDTYLITTDGRTYGLFGATPAVDTQIEQYKALGQPISSKCGEHSIPRGGKATNLKLWWTASHLPPRLRHRPRQHQ